MSLKSSIKTVLTLGQGVVGGLPDAAADVDPIDLFNVWFEAARESGLLLPDSMSLATSTVDGTPSVRMVLLKQADQDGFVCSDTRRRRSTHRHSTIQEIWPHPGQHPAIDPLPLTKLAIRSRLTRRAARRMKSQHLRPPSYER
jgi:hypothetical protein